MKAPSKGKGKKRASSDDISDTESETQGFEPQDSDKDRLWDVIAIRGERYGWYLIQWAGADKNGDPWPDSWVQRGNVTRDLVVAWNEEKKAKKREKARQMAEIRERKKRGSSGSALRSTTDSKRSTTTTSSLTPRRSKRVFSTNVVRGEDTASVSTIRSSRVKKRKQRIESDEDDGWSTMEEDISRKKRRIVSGRDSRRSSSRKKPKTKPPDSEEAEEESEHDDASAGKGSEQVRRTHREDSDEPESASSTLVRRTKANGRSEEAVRKPEPKPRKAVVHEHEEEEEEGYVIAEKPKVTTSARLQVEVVMDTRSPSVAKSKSRATGPAEAPDGSPVERRLSDRRPTPPRRTLTKSSSGRTGSRVPVTSSHDRLKNGKKRKGPPGVRPADLVHSEEEESSILHDGLSLPTAEKTMSKHDVSPSNESESGVVASPSQLGPDLTNGKEKSKPDDSRRESVSRASTAHRSETEEDDHGKTDKKVAASVQAPPTDGIVTAQPELKDPEFEEITDDIGGFDHSALDSALPDSQIHEPIDVRASSLEHTTTVSGDKIRENDVDYSREAQPDKPQSSKGMIIPPTQSQSQSQLHSYPDDAQEDLHLASILAVHGSDAVDVEVRADTDTQAHVAEPGDSSQVEIPQVALISSITDPEPSVESNAKVCGKIPTVTPSKFRPYLPQQKPLSTLPLPHLALRAKNDELTSSLQSSVKDFDGHTTEDMPDAHPADSQAPAEDKAILEVDDIEDEMPHSLELRQRGLELAEIQRQKAREEVQKPVPRVPLNELLERAGRTSRSGTSSGRSEGDAPSVSDEEGKQNLLDAAEEPTLGSEDDEVRIRQFEEDYIDFDGNAGAVSPASHRTDSSAADESERRLIDEEDEERQAMSTGDASEEADVADVESSLQDVIDENDPFLSRGGAKDRELTPTTTSSQQDDVDLPYTPSRTRFKILGSPSKLESPLLQTPSRQLNEAMGLLHSKSNEIEYLKRQLEESSRKKLSQDDLIAELRAENTVLKKTPEDRKASREVNEELVQQYKEKEESQAKEIEARDAEIKLLKMNWDDAVKQSEVFRESYGKASAFADEMKEQNKVLEERARLAEGQVNLGLDLIRKEHAGRERKLKEELEQQRILMSVMLARDRRTDDEVRRRAALEPELREQIDRLQEEIRDLKIAQGNIVHERNELLVERQELKEKLEQLSSRYSRTAEDMSWSQIQVARLTAREKAFKKVFLTTSASIHDIDSDRTEEKVYVCKWMSGFDGRSRCNSLFTNIQDLKDHLFVDHQL